MLFQSFVGAQSDDDDESEEFWSGDSHHCIAPFVEVAARLHRNSFCVALHEKSDAAADVGSPLSINEAMQRLSEGQNVQTGLAIHSAFVMRDSQSHVKMERFTEAGAGSNANGIE